jgi:hypothetical protein
MNSSVSTITVNTQHKVMDQLWYYVIRLLLLLIGFVNIMIKNIINDIYNGINNHPTIIFILYISIPILMSNKSKYSS